MSKKRLLLVGWDSADEERGGYQGAVRVWPAGYMILRLGMGLREHGPTEKPHLKLPCRGDYTEMGTGGNFCVMDGVVHVCSSASQHPTNHKP